jgi:hypothetical protein
MNGKTAGPAGPPRDRLTRRGAAWLGAALDVQLARFPLLMQSRAYLRLLFAVRRDWAWLLPLVVFTALRTYRRERRRVRSI